MYLVLTPAASISGRKSENGPFTPYFSNDISRIALAMDDDPSIVVYKLDGLTRIINIETTYQEEVE